MLRFQGADGGMHTIGLGQEIRAGYGELLRVVELGRSCAQFNGADNLCEVVQESSFLEQDPKEKWKKGDIIAFLGDEFICRVGHVRPG